MRTLALRRRYAELQPSTPSRVDYRVVFLRPEQDNGGPEGRWAKTPKVAPPWAWRGLRHAVVPVGNLHQPLGCVVLKDVRAMAAARDRAPSYRRRQAGASCNTHYTRRMRVRRDDRSLGGTVARGAVRSAAGSVRRRGSTNEDRHKEPRKNPPNCNTRRTGSGTTTTSTRYCTLLALLPGSSKRSTLESSNLLGVQYYTCTCTGKREFPTFSRPRRTLTRSSRVDISGMYTRTGSTIDSSIQYYR